MWGSIEKRNIMVKTLDLREWWWELVDDISNVEEIINNHKKWSFYWFRTDKDGKEWIVTLKDWKSDQYKLSETDIFYPLNTLEQQWIQISRRLSDTLGKNRIELDDTYKVHNIFEAMNRGKAWENEKFWFYNPEKTKIIIVDFTNWKKPRISDYKTEETEIVKII